MSLQIIGSNAWVVVTVLVAEGWILVVALRVALHRAGADLALLEDNLLEDLRRRAEHGHSPDWLAYRDAIDRYFDPRDDRLRSLAAAALATGLGGTVVAILVHLLTAPAPLQDDPGSALTGMGVALFGSLAGVVVHLVLVLFLMPTAERRFGAESRGLLDQLREASDANPPARAVVETFRKELERLQEFFTREFAGAFSTALGEFPMVVQELRSHLDRVAEAVEGQSGAAAETMKGLKESAGTIAHGSHLLEPAVRQLAEAGVSLDTLPQRLAEVLDEHRQEWQVALSAQQDEVRQNLVELVQVAEVRHRKISDQITQLQEVLSHLPDRVSEGLTLSLQVATPRLVGSFKQESAEMVERLLAGVKAKVEEGLAELSKRDRILQEKTATWVRDIFEEVHGTVEEHVSGPLAGTVEGLSSLAGRLDEISVRLEVAHQAWCSSHEEALAGWKEAGERIAGAGERLADGKSNVDEAVEALAASASHLERVSTLQEDFTGALSTALREATHSHLDELRPMYHRVVELAAEMEAARGRIELAMNRQSTVVMQLVRQVLAQRGLTTREMPVEA